MPHAEVQLAWKTQAGARHNLEGLENQDCVFVTQQHPLFDAVLMVADGMGGHPRPQEASEIAVRAAREYLFSRARLEAAGDTGRALLGALQAAHRAVRGLRNGGPRSPGTTLSIAVVAAGTLHVAHVGDGSVFLLHHGQVRALAGGEGRRAGNRPAQYLGQEDDLQPEQQRIRLSEGDRLLLCTDGLTRYFQEAGPEALERVLGRSGIEIQTLANQLTAHSRPDEYDDDTTVALAEVTGFSEAIRPPETATLDPAPQPARTSGAPRATEQAMRKTPEMSPVEAPRSALSIGSLAAGALLGGVLLGGGFAVGRATAPRAPATSAGPTAESPQPASPEQLRGLPAGNVVLLDSLNKRIFLLSTRSGAPGTEPLELQALQVGPAGRVVDMTGRFRLDPTRGVLTDPNGQSYPVRQDTDGTLHILRGGTLAVASRPGGARVSIDGRDVGAAPQELTVAAGRHTVRVSGRGWSSESTVEVPAGKTVTQSVSPQ